MNSQGPSLQAGITFKTAPHGAKEYETHKQPASTAFDLLKSACPQEHKKCKELLQASFHLSEDSRIYPSSNGFVRGAIKAYNQHHHLTIRPDDVWCAILAQFSNYVNAHAEDLRSQFVAHDSQKHLEVARAGSRYSVDFGEMPKDITNLIDENVIDPEVRGWIMPKFSTTTHDDTITAAVLFMGTMQQYFTYTFHMDCGIPSVTLLGGKADWENILHRLEKLKQYGEECTTWYGLLRAVVVRFVRSYTEPHSKENMDFWQRICHEYNLGSGPTYLKGWIIAFCFWDEDGKPLHHDPGSGKYLELDGAAFHSIDIEDVPSGFGTVPVKINDNGLELEAMMIAGSVGIEATSSGKALANGGFGLDTIRPVSAWWIFETHKQEQ